MQRRVIDETRKKHNGRCKGDLRLAYVRSAITNGKDLFAGDVDQRTAWVRRFRDLLYQHEEDLGGTEFLSEGQRSLCRRAAMLTLQLEMMESRWAENDGVASRGQLDLYARVTGNLRRVIETLGLHQGRRVRDVTPRLQDIIDGHAEPTQ